MEPGGNNDGGSNGSEVTTQQDPTTNEVIEHHESQTLRRSNRVAQTPRRYDGFEMNFYAENLKLLLALNKYESSNYQEAKDNPMRTKAMKEEIDSIEKMGCEIWFQN